MQDQYHNYCSWYSVEKSTILSNYCSSFLRTCCIVSTSDLWNRIINYNETASYRENFTMSLSRFLMRLSIECLNFENYRCSTSDTKIVYCTYTNWNQSGGYMHIAHIEKWCTPGIRYSDEHNCIPTKNTNCVYQIKQWSMHFQITIGKFPFMCVMTRLFSKILCTYVR